MAKRSYQIYKMSDEEYAKILENRRDTIRRKAEAAFDLEFARLQAGKRTLRQLSAATGLSPGTISYYRNREWGKRGPLLTTFLGIKLAK